MSIVKISNGNSKMGAIKSVSLPSVTTCVKCDCNKKCYSYKLERLRPNVREAYKSNLRLLKDHPEIYWREVEAAIMTSRFFRFHVGGDIVDADYFENMVNVAIKHKHCEILCFTKKYDIVNDYIGKHFELPINLHIIFSAWVGLEMANPFCLPVAHVRYRNGECYARPDAFECTGNCSECAQTSGGCWTLESGQEIVFNEH